MKEKQDETEKALLAFQERLCEFEADLRTIVRAAEKDLQPVANAASKMGNAKVEDSVSKRVLVELRTMLVAQFSGWFI